jgi:hypothetical protein
MEEHDDWKLGDEDTLTCPGCGKRNRPGLTYCIICGHALVDELEADSDSLRSLGEAMGRRRPPRRRGSLRAWSIAAGLLLVVVVALTWFQTREEPFRLEDWTRPAPERTLLPAPTTIATAVVVPTRRPLPPSPVATPAPPVATVVRATALPAATPPPVPTVRPASRATVRRPRPTPIAVAPVEPAEPITEATPDERPRVEATEKPSLGSDLQEATRAYRHAVDIHNARVDAYNAIADEVQRRNAWANDPESVELRRRLDRARQAVESARDEAELLRARMEEIRARYR